jgi:hypothetical protein
MTWVAPKSVGPFLEARHYLGPSARGLCWSDEFGVLILAKPTSRRLPHDGSWLELSRWCLLGIKNGGSQQWRRVVRELRVLMPDVTTVISYSDPAVGHTGALYKSCNWLWRPTWHRLRPPPSGNGKWKEGAAQSVKDRWMYPLRPDERREPLLAVQDTAAARLLEQMNCRTLKQPQRAEVRDPC